MRSTVLLAVAAGLAVFPVAARADLAGDTVHAVYEYPTATTTFDDLGYYAVPGMGTVGGTASFLINPTSIVITDLVADNFGGPFNGFSFTDITKDPGITGATVDGVSTVSGAMLSTTSDQVLINLTGLSVTPGQQLVVDLNFAPATSPTSPTSVTPEPSSIALLGTGLLGLGGVLRKRFV